MPHSKTVIVRETKIGSRTKNGWVLFQKTLRKEIISAAVPDAVAWKQNDDFEDLVQPRELARHAWYAALLHGIVHALRGLLI
jgi:hypothetical protein